MNRFRDWFAASLGVSPERKEEVYLELAKSATLRDITYWLQILFAAGVATLGLVLNSPAVIIGAMLISPLMGPILAVGLALASGDLILGIRASGNLLLSSLVAVGFSVALVGLLPFKEMTNEIAARTQPNTLDLVIALFSGAIGSVATCREARGVVTSIPGVAIAVALMPPLGVVGYGIGVAVSLSGAEGMRVARGGGLLFLTNLVAITFMAMLVFLALHIDTEAVRERVRAWRRGDQESEWVRRVMERFHLSDKLRQIGGFPGRFLSILIPFLLILIPLSQSLSQLKQQYTRQQQDNRVRQAATELWQRYFEQAPGGEPRSYLDQLTFSEQDGRLTFFLRVFTSQPYTASERTEWMRLVASRLNRPVESINLQLIEIPTVAAELASKAREEKRAEAPPTVAQLRASFWQGVESALRSLQLPPAVRLVDYRVVTGATEPLRVVVTYLGEREIGEDAQALITGEIRARFADPVAGVSFERIPTTIGPLTFRRNQAEISADDAELLDRAGQVLRQQPRLRLEIVAQAEAAEREGTAANRARAVTDYLTAKWEIAPEGITTTAGTDGRTALLNLQLADKTP
jgi:uncharacterized hydrophobic protein (TIGR00271 family)